MTDRKTVLLVDDEKEFADALAKRLERRNFCVKIAYSASEVLRLAQNDVISATIPDVNLPAGNGHALLDDISSIHPEIKAIILTGYGNILKAFHLVKMGLCAYFSKPCDTEELTMALSNALEE